MKQVRQTNSRGWAAALLTPLVLFTCNGLRADDKKPAPAKPAAAPAKPAAAPAAHTAAPGGAAHPAAAPGGAAHPATPATGAHPATPGAAGHPGATAPGHTAAPAAGHPGATGTGHPGVANGFKSPGKVETGHNGAQFQRDSHGNVRDIRHGDLAVHRGPHGEMRNERVRADGSRFVGDRRGGFVEHRYRYGGRELYRRNYYYGGRYYSRFYNPYAYRGVYVNVYAPAYYYGPAFYGYAYAPWGVPVAYSWGWAGNPWYGYYGGYFTPYPVYASPSLWLTDYLVAQSLQAAYAQQAAAQQGGAPQQQQFAGGDSAPAPMTPEVKQQIADEVRRQIALENAERQNLAPNAMPDPASSGIARMLSDNTAHVFVAAAALSLVSGAGECAVTEGDVLQLNGAPPAGATSATAVVLASKGQDCPKGSRVQVAFNDLQDMQNHMRETIDEGMGELQKKQGTGGLPALPPSAAAPPTQTGFAAIAPPPDPSEATEIAKQNQEATQAEQDALASALGGPSDSAAAPATAAAPADTDLTNKTVAEVEAIMGQPKTKAGSGAKLIYVYPSLKVTFTNGKVTDIQ